MASILRHIKDGKWSLPRNDDSELGMLRKELTQSIAESLKAVFWHSNLKSVKIDAVLKDVASVGSVTTTDCGDKELEVNVNYEQFSRCNPPFPFMWLEGRDEAMGKIGFTVIRQSLGDNVWDSLISLKRETQFIPAMLTKHPELKNRGTLVMSHVFIESNGGAIGPIATMAILLDTYGQWVHSRTLVMFDGLDEEKASAHFSIVGFQLGHCLFRMNCSNIRLEPVGGVPHKKNKLHREPEIVWHEIKITSVPKIGPRKGDGNDPIEIRSHWVRGHYSDYTKSSGLFGNPKLRAVFWMPEHKRGNEALGEVMASYKIVEAVQ